MLVMLAPEVAYPVLFVMVALYPEYHLWRDISNDHDDQWIAICIIGSFMANVITLYALQRKSVHRTAVSYFRDAVLGFQLATCIFASIRQAIISYPQIDREKDGNVVAGWLMMFMAVIAHNEYKLHQRKSK